MPAFIVTLDQDTGHNLPGGANSMVVFATNEANAQAIAAGHFEGDSQAAWNTGSAGVQVVAADDFSDPKWSFRVIVEHPTTPVSVQANGGISGVVSVVENDRGTAYVVGDIITLVGGTFSRAASFRVTAETAGVIDVGGIELVDPGEYTVNTALTGIATAGHTADATVDVTYATNQAMNLIAEAVGLLNADADIAGAAANIQDTAGTPDLLVASGSGGTGGTDDLGDANMVIGMFYGESQVPELIGAITDSGAASDDLSAVLPVSFALVSVATPLKS